MKKIALVVGLVMFSFSVLAGGSIFGGHKKRTYNPQGVSSVGAYVCGSLICPPVRILDGDCTGVEHANVQYGVCLCDEGYVADGGKCVLETPCGESEKVKKTYYIGACCDVPVEGLFCPEEDTPTCEKMDETTCDQTTEASCENVGGDWVCPEYQFPCICAPKGSKTGCTDGSGCIACKPEEEVRCPIMADCACQKEGIDVKCNTVYCKACSDGLKTVCDGDVGECACVFPQDVGNCSNGNIYLSYKEDPCATETPHKGDPNMECVKNSDCSNTEFCSLQSETSLPSIGECKPLNTGITYTYNDGNSTKTFLVSDESMNWWESENWCKAHHMDLVKPDTLSELCGCNASQNCITWDTFTNDNLWDKSFPKDIPLWTTINNLTFNGTKILSVKTSQCSYNSPRFGSDSVFGKLHAWCEQSP